MIDRALGWLGFSLIWFFYGFAEIFNASLEAGWQMACWYGRFYRASHKKPIKRRRKVAKTRRLTLPEAVQIAREPHKIIEGTARLKAGITIPRMRLKAKNKKRK